MLCYFVTFVLPDKALYVSLSLCLVLVEKSQNATKLKMFVTQYILSLGLETYISASEKWLWPSFRGSLLQYKTK